MMDLVQHADRPELTIRIGDQDYDFGEITIDKFAVLQEWINKNVPHPLEELKNGRLDGLPEKVQVSLAEAARLEARHWPPKIGTANGSGALLSKESGQILALHIGLQKFQPGITAKEAEQIYHQIGKDSAKLVRTLGRKLEPKEQPATRIFGVMFNLGDPGEDDPKDEGDRTISPGTPSTGVASANSA